MSWVSDYGCNNLSWNKMKHLNLLVQWDMVCEKCNVFVVGRGSRGEFKYTREKDTPTAL
jgi:hypothetical protein